MKEMIQRISGYIFAVAVAAATAFAQQPAAVPAQPQAAPQAPAQNSPDPQPPGTGQDQPGSDVPIVKIITNEVSLIFTVTDKHGHYIPNLQQSDFALLDDQKAPEKIKDRKSVV